VIRPFLALALNSFREARRNKISVVVAAFAFALLLSATLVTEVTVYSMERVITDFGLGAMSLTMVLLAVFLSTGQLSREIERRTIFLIVSKPVSRPLFLVSRFAGNMLTLGVMLAVMGVVFFVQVVMSHYHPTYAQLIALGMLWVELLVLSSVGFAMSSFSSQMVSAVVTTGVYFAGHLASDIYTLSGKAKAPILQMFGRAMYYLLPNLDRLNFRARATYNLATAPTELLQTCLYGFSYAAVMITIAVILFNRRDFR
jgi:Cu-processing system permease protein